MQDVPAAFAKATRPLCLCGEKRHEKCALNSSSFSAQARAITGHTYLTPDYPSSLIPPQDHAVVRADLASREINLLFLPSPSLRPPPPHFYNCVLSRTWVAQDEVGVALHPMA